jgi:archaellum component FlaG (FlaF/FlaG flagellin family)
LNNAPGNQITNAYVIKNQSENHSWNISGAITKTMTHGFWLKGGFNYGVSRSMVEPSSTAATSWGGANPIVFDPNNPALAYSTNSPGKRVFLAANYTRQYFGFGATTISAFYDGHTNGNTSFVFAGDANNESVSGNDLVYIPRNTSEMNFKPLLVSGRTFSPAEQAAAFEQLILSDSYLSSHRGEYAQRNAVFLPIVNRVDLNLTQDVFASARGRKHAGQIRLDITNFGNMLNKDWGAGRRLVNTQILTAPSADANGALTYNLQTLSGNLLTNSIQTSAGINDVYVMMLSFRYTFQ